MNVLRKINRGVILMVALVLLVWGYEVAMYYQKKPYMDAVRPKIVQYLNVYSKYSVMPENYRNITKMVPSEEYNKLVSECESELKGLFLNDSVLSKQFSESILSFALYNSKNQNSRSWLTESKMNFDSFGSTDLYNNKFDADVKTLWKFSGTIVDLKSQIESKFNNKDYDFNAKGKPITMHFSFVNKDNNWYITKIY